MLYERHNWPLPPVLIPFLFYPTSLSVRPRDRITTRLDTGLRVTLVIFHSTWIPISYSGLTFIEIINAVAGTRGATLSVSYLYRRLWSGVGGAAHARGYVTPPARAACTLCAHRIMNISPLTGPVRALINCNAN